MLGVWQAHNEKRQVLRLCAAAALDVKRLTRKEIEARIDWLSEEERVLLAALHGGADEDLDGL